MTSQTKKAKQPEPTVIDTPQATIQPTPTLDHTLLHTTYTIVADYPGFKLNIIELYSDNTWKHVGYTDREPLPHLFNRVEKLLMKGKKL